MVAINKQVLEFQVRPESPELIPETFTIENPDAVKKCLIYKIKCSNIEIFKVEKIMGIVYFGDVQTIKVNLRKSVFVKQAPLTAKFLIEYIQVEDSDEPGDQVQKAYSLYKKYKGSLQSTILKTRFDYVEAPREEKVQLNESSSSFKSLDSGLSSSSAEKAPKGGTLAQTLLIFLLGVIVGILLNSKPRRLLEK